MTNTTWITLVGSLISAISTGVALYLRGRNKERMAAIQRASGSDAIRLAGDTLVLFGIDPAKLTKQQQFELALKQLADRDRQNSRIFWLASLFTLSFVVGAGILLVKHFSAPSIVTAPPEGITCKSIASGLTPGSTHDVKPLTGIPFEKIVEECDKISRAFCFQYLSQSVALDNGVKRVLKWSSQARRRSMRSIMPS